MVAYLGCTISCNAVARCTQDQSQNRKENHEGKAGRTVPEVEDFGNRHVSSGRHDAGHGRNERNQGMRFEVAGDVGRQVGGDLGLEGIDKVQAPHSVCRQQVFTFSQH